jgi:hypothetical protein
MSVLVRSELFAAATIVLNLICPLSLPDDWVKDFAQHFACGKIDKVQASTGGARHSFVVPRAVLPGLAFPVVHQLLYIEPCNRALKNDYLHDGKTSSRLWPVFKADGG